MMFILTVYSVPPNTPKMVQWVMLCCIHDLKTNTRLLAAILCTWGSDTQMRWVGTGRAN